MTLLYEFLPIVLFFLTFKFQGIYAATVVGIVATLIQVVVSRLISKKWDNKQLIALVVFVVFGGMTLYFHNPIFVKWKPTIVFWIFSSVILFTHFFSQKPLMQRFMENVVEDAKVPNDIWKKINIIWAIFFISLGAINLYIAYHFSNNAWVNFKFYGITSALIVLSIFQACYLMQFISEPQKK